MNRRQVFAMFAGLPFAGWLKRKRKAPEWRDVEPPSYTCYMFDQCCQIGVFKCEVSETACHEDPCRGTRMNSCSLSGNIYASILMSCSMSCSMGSDPFLCYVAKSTKGADGAKWRTTDDAKRWCIETVRTFANELVPIGPEALEILAE